MYELEEEITLLVADSRFRTIGAAASGEKSAFQFTNEKRSKTSRVEAGQLHIAGNQHLDDTVTTACLRRITDEGERMSFSPMILFVSFPH